MIQYRDEDDPIKDGLNIYKHGNKHSWGWVFRAGCVFWSVRYSYFRQRWFVSLKWISQRRHDAIVGSWS